MYLESNSNLNCPFCDNTQSYRYLAETELVRAIYPKSPASNYHILLMPKRHEQFLHNLDDGETLQLHNLMQGFVQAAQKNIPDFAGYNILSNNGSEFVNQRVKHAHVHLFLRSNSDKTDPIRTPHAGDPKPLTEDQLKIVEQLKKWLNAEYRVK